MQKHRLLWLTDRGAFHQDEARRACPPELELRILRAPSDDELAAAIGDAEFLISERNQPVSGRAIAAARALRLIVRLGSLAYDIDVKAAAQRGIELVVQPVKSSIAAAEHTLMMILAVLKRLGRALASIHDQSPVAPRPTREDVFAYNFARIEGVLSLDQRSVMILGMGEIGVELARRLKPFAPRAIRYHKRHRYPEHVERELGVEYAEVVSADADVLVSLLPYVPHAITAETFDRLRPGSIFVHAGSGGAVDEDALLAALERGHLGGAALDTFTEEPLSPDHPLAVRARDPRSNLLLTPHVASGTEPIDRREDFAAVMRFLSRTQGP